MKSKTLYVCELCHTDYSEKANALDCERNHKTDLKIVSQRFLPYTTDKSGLPRAIVVQDSKGNQFVYKR